MEGGGEGKEGMRYFLSPESVELALSTAGGEGAKAGAAYVLGQVVHVDVAHAGPRGEGEGPGGPEPGQAYGIVTICLVAE